MKITHIGNVDEDNFGPTSAKFYHVVLNEEEECNMMGGYARGRNTIADIIAKEFPESYCTHSHDCCGQWYASRGVIISNTRRVLIVRHDWAMNV
tara:strand:- start:395 stop:676 length:282 start_codon:yes stop_codon:yes gene_type:complete